MALTILDKEKFGSFKIDEKVLQKTTDSVIKKNAENKKREAKGEKLIPKKSGYVSNF
mgnify:CR=1 FL=1